MDAKFIFLCVVLSFQVHLSYENCAVKLVTGKQEYVCNTIQELERFGNPYSLNVTVHKDGIVPRIDEDRKPNMKIVLLDEEGKDGLSSTALQILTDLEKIATRRGSINFITRGIFENLPIKNLELEDNGINNIDKGSFNNMTNLEDLRIIKNNLRIVEFGVFNGLPVETLALSNNRIVTIKRYAFNDMRNLKNLYLDGNQLSEFHPEFLLNYASKVDTLYLNGNLLTEINPATVRGLDNVRVLFLGNNNIGKIFSYTFEALTNLENVVLSNNKLQELNADVFPQNGTRNLQKLQLNDNRLSFIPFNTLRRLQSLKYIRLGGNPWSCACLDELLQWLSSRDIQQKCDRHYYSGTRPVCVSIDNHSNSCDYITDDYYYTTYNSVNGKYPKSPECDL